MRAVRVEPEVLRQPPGAPEAGRAVPSASGGRRAEEFSRR